MKLTGDFQDWTVTQSTMGRILSLTPGRISQLVDEKIITKDDGEKNAVFLVESMQNYYQTKQSYQDLSFKKAPALRENLLPPKSVQI